MDTAQLSQQLTRMRDEAHQLSKAELADAPGRPERGEKARVLKRDLDSLQSQIVALPAGDQSPVNDLWQAVNRYLVLPLMIDQPEADSDPLSEANKLHNDILDTAKQMAVGTLSETDRTRRIADFQKRSDALLKQPNRTDPAVERVLGDIDLDLMYITFNGNAPSSTHLAQVIRDLRRG